MPQNTFWWQSTLVQVMTWWCQATSHYLGHSWSRSILSYIYTFIIGCAVRTYIGNPGGDSSNEMVISHAWVHLGSPGDATLVCHDDVIKWKHFPHYWPFVRGIHRSPVNSPHNGQWSGALMFSLICVWIDSWVNNREAGDFRRCRGHYNVTVMQWRKNPNYKLTNLLTITQFLPLKIHIKSKFFFAKITVHISKSLKG